jgi:hypothetical protein
MQETKKILKKRFKGDSQRSIASMLHISRNNVSKVFKAADKSEFTCVQFQNMDESQINEILFSEEKYVPIQTMPDFDYVQECPSMNQEEWINYYINVYKYFDGVIRLLISDNLKNWSYS